MMRDLERVLKTIEKKEDGFPFSDIRFANGRRVLLKRIFLYLND